jgi:hypothetical protein
MPADEYEISAHTGQRFRSGGWNNGVGFRLCMHVIPASVNENRHQDAECRSGAELVQSVEQRSHIANVLFDSRRGSVIFVVQYKTSTGRSCVRCSARVSFWQRVCSP